MFADITSQVQGAFASGSTTERVVVRYPCVVRDADAVVNADPGDNETIEIKKESTLIGTLTFGESIAAGATATYTPDPDHGNDVIEKGDVLSFVTSAAAAAPYHLTIEYDPSCTVPEP